MVSAVVLYTIDRGSIPLRPTEDEADRFRTRLESGGCLKGYGLRVVRLPRDRSLAARQLPSKQSHAGSNPAGHSHESSHSSSGVVVRL